MHVRAVRARRECLCDKGPGMHVRAIWGQIIDNVRSLMDRSSAFGLRGLGFDSEASRVFFTHLFPFFQHLFAAACMHALSIYTIDAQPGKKGLPAFSFTDL